MYVCKEHGPLTDEWCDDCQELIQCDCTDQTRTRFKDLCFDCENGERTQTIYLNHCATCGHPTGVELR